MSAALVGLSVLFGIPIPEWGQWLVFAVLALFFFFTFRRTLYLKIRGGGENYPESMSGESITMSEDLEPGKETRSQYRGSDWTVRNVGASKISGGARARIVKVIGLTLNVTAE